jgi:hypothetical protein
MKRLLGLILLLAMVGNAIAAPATVAHKAHPAPPRVKKALAIAPPLAGSVTLTAAAATGGTETLTWTTSASPNGIAAASCAASGGWSGAQAPGGGSFTTPPVTATTVYTLVCTWNDTTTTLAWTNPTTLNTGAPFTDQISVNLYQGTAPTGLTRLATLTGTPTSDVLTAQPAGTNYYAVSAISKSDGEGTPSNTVAKTNGAATATASTTVTVAALPSPPTNVTAQ